ncbi:MAG: choice-of-anchor D domain-containing protein, partial [Candidatus Rokubacteria bacterium]|nr:choice-of-anchor D domain-containing protein [Candidatus Rokubacteria bacterium]
MSFLWKPSRRVIAASFVLLTPISPHKRHTARRRLLGLGLALLSIFFLAPAAHAGILDASWTAPTTNADGSALTDLASYRLYYGTSNPVTCPGGSTFVTVPSPTSSPAAGTTVNYQLKGLQAGTTYYVKVTAVDTSGNESACSVQASAPARIAFSVTPTSRDFGTVNVGSTADRTFTVQNTVGGTVSGTATASAPFSIVSGSPFNLVGLNATQTVTVRFTPTTGGVAAGNVNFTADGDTISRAVTGDAAPLTLTSLTPDRTSPQPPGTTITYTATASGGTAPYQYKWWLFDGTSWNIVQTWSTSNTFTWTPTAAGNYTIGIWIRSATNTADNYEISGTATFTISSGPLTLTSLTPDRTSPQPPGTTITYTATATGGIPPYQYKWWLFDGTSWNIVQTWSTSNTFTWTPTA